MSKKSPVAIALIAFTMLSSAVDAANVDQVINREGSRIKQNQQSQQRIDKTASRIELLNQSLRNETKIVDGLKVYNQQLQQQIKAQISAREDLRQSIQEVAIIERQIVPLTLKMIDSLEAYIALDLPFLMPERRARIDTIKDLMTDVNVSAAERFRKVLEAYEIETAYGRSIEAYTDTLTLSGQAIAVDMLRIGRTALYYQSKDGRQSGVWDAAANGWQALDSADHRHIRTAIRVARKQRAPELLTLPIQAPEIP